MTNAPVPHIGARGALMPGLGGTVSRPSTHVEGIETTTSAPAETTTPDTLAAALAAGHAPDSLAVHAAQLGLSTLEKPMTIAEAAAAAGEDGFLTAVVEVSLSDLMEGRANAEAGEESPLAREMVEEDPEPAQMG